MTTSEATSWQRGRLDARRGPRQVLFGRMYEDAAIELAAFRPGGRIMCIASAGCTAIKLAPHHQVVAVDINPVQLAYLARRLDGAPGARGRAERIMDVMRAFGPLVGWWSSRVRDFLELEDPAAQLTYWHAHLDTWRFRAALDRLFSKAALRSVYAPRLLEVLPPQLGAVMRGRIERTVARHPNRRNPYARALLLGELSTEPPPPQARELRLVHDDAAAFLERQPAASFDGFTLSNILDGAGPAYRARLVAAVQRAAAPGAVTVLRSFAEPEAEPGSPDEHAAADRSLLWGSVLVRPASALA